MVNIIKSSLSLLWFEVIKIYLMPFVVTIAYTIWKTKGYISLFFIYTLTMAGREEKETFCRPGWMEVQGRNKVMCQSLYSEWRETRGRTNLHAHKKNRIKETELFNQKKALKSGRSAYGTFPALQSLLYLVYEEEKTKISFSKEDDLTRDRWMIYCRKPPARRKRAGARRIRGEVYKYR